MVGVELKVDVKQRAPISNTIGKGYLPIPVFHQLKRKMLQIPTKTRNKSCQSSVTERRTVHIRLVTVLASVVVFVLGIRMIIVRGGISQIGREQDRVEAGLLIFFRPPSRDPNVPGANRHIIRLVVFLFCFLLFLLFFFILCHITADLHIYVTGPNATLARPIDPIIMGMSPLLSVIPQKLATDTQFLTLL